MKSVEEALHTSRARLEDSHRRILRSAASECETRSVVERTRARVKESEELLSNGTEFQRDQSPDISLSSASIRLAIA